MLQNCKYFAKDSLKYFPAIGWGMYLMGMIFIKRQWNNDRGSIEKTFQTIKTTKVPAWIISYLEGSRQTPEKLHDSQVYAAKKGLPVLKNVMLPRTKGFVATVNAFRNTHIKAVYDLTIAYKHDEKGFQAFPSVINLHTTPLKGYHFNIHVRRFLIADLPEDEEELSQWVINMWKEKDEILEYMKTNWTDGLPMVDLPSPLWKSATREESRPLLASA
ncbi:hypothetical protein HK098_004369 [Nowakowskiella sp. JEL0407]|nr:hypothetical protein HK098_004369 [Nowakowskiella sp. JEL0407]